MRLPDFVVIGAAKSGTTSLHRYLGQHPGVFVSGWGEPSFFAHEGEAPRFSGPGDDEWSFVTRLEDYAALFDSAPDGARVGEVSPRYLYFERSVANMRHHVPGARLLAVLRHPVDRAYSHFLMNRARGCEPEADFRQALHKEWERRRQGWGWDWSYVSAGLYGHQLQRYVDVFPSDQLRVYLYDDWRADERSFFTDVFTFLGVDPGFRPDTSRRERVATSPRSHTVARLLRPSGPLRAVSRAVVPTTVAAQVRSGTAAWNRTDPPTLPEATRRELFDAWFAEDCRRLAELMGRDLHEWNGRGRQ